MHHKVYRFFKVTLQHLFHVSLMMSKPFRRKLDVTWFVNTMNISKGSGDRKHWSDLREGFVDRPDLLRCGIKFFRVDILIVHTIFYSSSDTDFHLQPDLHRCHALEVFNTSHNVFVVGFRGKIDHVRRKQRFSVHGEKLFVGLEHTVEPRKKFLGAVVGVKDNGNIVVLGYRANVHCEGHGTRNGFVWVLHTIPCDVICISVGNLNNDGCFRVLRSFQDGIYCRRTGTVHSGEGIRIFTGVFEKFQEVVASDNPRRHNVG
mmetsp:Transcript_7252/g.17684  ORF Transcript_7252/g.17684 Transcript_7252/m.17684 type:complete len:260 (+) Transcript_7252:546-1325(+)